MLVGKVNLSSEQTYWLSTPLRRSAFSCTDKVITCWEFARRCYTTAVSSILHVTTKTLSLFNTCDSLVSSLVVIQASNIVSLVGSFFPLFLFQPALKNAIARNFQEEMLLSYVAKCSKTRDLWNSISEKEPITIFFSEQNQLIINSNHIGIRKKLYPSQQFHELANGLVAISLKPHLLEISYKVENGDLSKEQHEEEVFLAEWKKYVAQIDLIRECVKELNWENEISFDKAEYSSSEAYKKRNRAGNINHIHGVWEKYGRNAYCEKHIAAKECTCCNPSKVKTNPF